MTAGHFYLNTVTLQSVTRHGVADTSRWQQSKGSSESWRSTVPPSTEAAFTLGTRTLWRAAFTASDTASNRLPPHSKICNKEITRFKSSTHDQSNVSTTASTEGGWCVGGQHKSHFCALSTNSYLTNHVTQSPSWEAKGSLTSQKIPHIKRKESWQKDMSNCLCKKISGFHHNADKIVALLGSCMVYVVHHKHFGTTNWSLQQTS